MWGGRGCVQTHLEVIVGLTPGLWSPGGAGVDDRGSYVTLGWTGTGFSLRVKPQEGFLAVGVLPRVG
jgi:hypothetical protein